MYTRCPTCSTCFRVTDRHLAIANGKVRCGQCQLVFNAPEHAIDDLPVNQITSPPVPTSTPSPKAETKQPISPPVKKAPVKTSPILDSSKEEITEINIEPEKISKPVEPVKQPLTKTPFFDSDATMIADVSALDNNELENIDLDTPSNIQGNDDNEDDEDLFNDDFDLNSAIDELNDFNDEDDDDETTEEDLEVETKQYIPDDNDDVFNTDAYQSTNASSVADIMNEMEGQLSLNIAEPNHNEEYDVNKEFNFLKLDDAEEQHAETKDIEENTVDEFNFIDDDEEDSTEDKDGSEYENAIDKDELFDQVDLSDFQDSDIEDEIVLKDPSLENVPSEEIKLKQTEENADDIPFQLRNDIKHLQTSSPRQWHPLLSLSIIVILLILSFSQLAYFRAHELVKLSPSTRPLLEAFCENVGCNYSGPRDIKQIQLLSRDVRLHPKEKKALLISAAMINNAYFSQPYPDIHIRLSDISGNIIAERVFNAKTYMGKLSNPFLLMKSKTPVHINFEVVDPGKDAVNFEFTFL